MQRYTVPYVLLNILTLLECAMSTYVSRIKPKSVSVSNVCNIAFVHFTQRLRETKFCWKSVNPLCCMYFTPAFILTSRVPFTISPGRLYFKIQYTTLPGLKSIIYSALCFNSLHFFYTWPDFTLVWPIFMPIIHWSVYICTSIAIVIGLANHKKTSWYIWAQVYQNINKPCNFTWCFYQTYKFAYDFSNFLLPLYK